jgi:K(+)-stimulated pyrophosphate-energized sodium pump
MSRTTTANAPPLLRGRTRDEIRRYDLFKLLVALALLVNWLWFCRSPAVPAPDAGPAAAVSVPPAASAPATAASTPAPPAPATAAAPPPAVAVPATGAASPPAEVELERPPPAASGPGVPPLASLYFAFDRTELPADARATLADLTAYLRANPQARLGLSGFHDAFGDAAHNAELAKNRARAVREYLVGAGVDRAQLLMIRPQSTLGGDEPRQARRVDVYVAQ